MIRSEEFRAYRNGPAPITLAGGYMSRCADDKHAITECINEACRWSGVCNLDDRRDDQ
jgi:hypothetical protein